MKKVIQEKRGKMRDRKEKRRKMGDGKERESGKVANTEGT
jgi:hypothetical protein